MNGVAISRAWTPIRPLAKSTIVSLSFETLKLVGTLNAFVKVVAHLDLVVGTIDKKTRNILTFSSLSLLLGNRGILKRRANVNKMERFRNSTLCSRSANMTETCLDTDVTEKLDRFEIVAGIVEVFRLIAGSVFVFVLTLLRFALLSNIKGTVDGSRSTNSAIAIN